MSGSSNSCRSSRMNTKTDGCSTIGAAALEVRVVVREEETLKQRKKENESLISHYETSF
jgi:hypothetical protein